MSVDVNKIKQLADRTRARMRVTKVVATRAVKTKRGDFFCGMSAAWDSFQDDQGGQAQDLDLTSSAADEASSGMTIEEARVAQVLLNLEATMGALRAALTDNAISKSMYEDRVKTAKRNTLAHLSRMMPTGEAAARVAEVKAQ